MYKREETLDSMNPTPRIAHKTTTATMNKHRTFVYETEWYCERCHVSRKFWKDTCPDCGAPTAEREIAVETGAPTVHSYRTWYAGKERKEIRSYAQEKRWMRENGKMDTRDTGHLDYPPFREKIKEYKWKAKNGLLK